MVKRQTLYNDINKLVPTKVVAATISFSHISWADEKKRGSDNGDDAKNDMAAKHAEYAQKARAKGVTPIMAIVITEKDIYVLDWIGNNRWPAASIPTTRILVHFARDACKVHIAKLCPKLLATKYYITIEQEGTSIDFAFRTAWFAPNASMNRDVLDELLKAL